MSTAPFFHSLWVICKRSLPKTVILFLILAIIIAIIEIIFPYRPTQEEAVNVILVPSHAIRTKSPLPRDFRIAGIEPFDRWQIVLTTYTRADQTACFAIDYITKHLLTGAAIEAGTGRCYDPAKQESTIVMNSLRKKVI